VGEIVFSADESALDRAHEVARSEGRTLEVAFREWLDAYASKGAEQYPRATEEEIRDLYHRLRYVDAGRKFTRDEMNER